MSESAIDLAKYPKYLLDQFFEMLLEGAQKYYADPANQAKFERWVAEGGLNRYAPYMTPEERRECGCELPEDVQNRERRASDEKTRDQNRGQGKGL